MLAAVVYCNNPFRPSIGREIKYLKRRARVDRLAPKTESPFIAILNGDPILRATWSKTYVGNGDALAFVTLPQGGGGSNPLRIVLTIAVLVVASWAGAALAQAGVVTTLGGLAAVKAGIVLGGIALVNAVIPPPKVPTPKAARDIAAASPTYSLSAQGNQARLGQAIPVIYGRHLIYPDFAAQPYAEFSGNDQFLYQLFVIGQGKYTIEAIRIEDTPISSFPGVNTEVVPPGGSVTLFPTNVVTSVEVVGQEALQGVPLGPFVVNASGTIINHIGIDLVMPKGLYFANDAGGLDAKTVQWRVEARVIDNAGAPVGGFFVVAEDSFTAATTTPQRKTFRYVLTPGRYDVRLTRLNAKDLSTRAGNDLNWTGLRGYLPGSQFYGNVTMLAVRMQATNSLSELSSRRINLIVTRKLSSWSTAGGYSAETDNRGIAWAALDMLKNSDYGAGLPDTRINLAQLEALNAVWAVRGDTFNAVFDGQMSLWEALTHVMRTGRAVPIIQGGIYHFVRDQFQSVPVAMFSNRNIVRNSFSIEYLMTTDETTDSAESEFFDEVTWKPKPVSATLPSGTNLKPAKLQAFFGITGFNQAWRETLHAAAQNRYRRKIIRFQTEMEGFIPTFGDMIAISHDMPSWAQNGHITNWISGTGELTTSEPLDFSAGGTHQIALVRRDGTPEGPFTATPGSSSNKCLLAIGPSFTPYTGVAEEKTRYVFGPVTEYWQLARAIEIKPRDMEHVEILCVNEDAAVHNADGGPAPDQSINWSLPATPTAPIIPIGSLFLVAGGTPDAATISASWSPAPGAAYYVVDHSVDTIAWTRIAELTLTNHTLSVPIGLNHVRVAGFGKAQGPFISASLSITGNAVAASTPPQITGLVATAGLTSIFLEWSDPNYANASHYELFRNTTNVFGTAKQLPSLLPPTTLFNDPLGQTNQTRFYWMRIVSKKAIPGPLTGPVTATTGKIGNTDLNDLIITAQKLANGAVGAVQLGDGSVTATKIGAAAIGTAAIQNAAITNALIGSFAVDSAKIANGAIVNAKIGTSEINGAKISNAAITTAHIIDANVTTLKIAGQAVTVPVSVSSGAITLSPATWTTVLLTAMSNTGAPVNISMSAGVSTSQQGGPGLGDVTGQMRLLIDGGIAYQSGVVAGIVADTGTISGGQPALVSKLSGYISAAVTVAPAVGGHTYALQVQVSAAGGTYDSSMLIIETKR